MAKIKIKTKTRNDFNSFLLKDNSSQFYSQTLSPLECDLVLANQLKNLDLEYLSFINYRCWFDYRFLHPIQRIYYFSFLFFTLSEKYKVHSGDIENAGFINPYFRYNDISKANKTKLANACMVIDYNGVPYDFWLDKTFEFHLSNGGRFDTNKIIDRATTRYVLERWRERFESSVVVAKSSAYLIDNHEENIYAEDYQGYLISHVENLASRNFYIKTLHNENKHLSAQTIINKYGKEFYDNEIRI